MSLGLIITALEQGGIFAVMALGVYITYKILDFPDLTVDGSFPLGGAVTAALISGGTNPILAMLASTVAGMVAGLVTGIIHIKFRIRDLLSGIIVMTGLYSVNFLIIGKLPSLSIPSRKFPNIFSNVVEKSLFAKDAPLEMLGDYSKIIILVLVLIVLKVALDFFMSSKRGYLLKAMGDNPMVVATLAKNGGNVKIMGLMIANGFVALSGSLLCQYNGGFYLTDGTGKMVIGLAAVIIGVNIFGKIKFLKSTTAVIIGSIMYMACVTIALNSFEPQEKNLVTAILFLIVLVAGQTEIKRHHAKHSDRRDGGHHA